MFFSNFIFLRIFDILYFFNFFNKLQIFEINQFKKWDPSLNVDLF